MGRAVLVPTWVAAILLALILAMASPALAQNNGSDGASDPLEGQTASIEEDSIGPIAVAGCAQVDGETATITIADDLENGDESTFTDGDGVTFRFGEQGITIRADDGGSLVGDGFNKGTGRVVSSSGIQCGTGRDADGGNGNDGDGVQTADDLLNISCENLLELFRSGTGQYGDAALFADPEVRERVEECLEEEVVGDTAADGDLPNTGGLSLLGFAALGVVSAVAVLAVIRGGRTEG